MRQARPELDMSNAAHRKHVDQTDFNGDEFAALWRRLTSRVVMAVEASVMYTGVERDRI